MRWFRLTLTVFVAALLPALWGWAQDRNKPRVRAEPPKWNPSVVDGIFFSDVFKQGTVGTRPDVARLATGGTATPATTPMAGGDEAPAGGIFAWSKLISATTLEDEVKASKLVLDAEVSTPAKFNGSGYKVARKQFSVLAVMFGIIGEYDADVRWKDDAPGARDLFARTAANCKVGTIQVFNESKQRKVDLEDLLNGAGLKDRTGERKATWPQVTDRSPLMQRLEAGHKEKLQPFTANKGEFKDNSEELFHEAQLAAAFAEVLLKEGMEDADDDDYREFAERMRKAASDVVDAVKSDNYDKARAAVGEIDKTCTECHQSYRA